MSLCTLGECDDYIRVVAVIAVAAAAASLYIALRLRDSLTGRSPNSQWWHRPLAYWLIGMWVLVPPIWFFFEFEFLHPLAHSDGDEFTRLKHAQDLASKIWVALVVALAAAMNIKWPPEVAAQGQQAPASQQAPAPVDRPDP